jgi:hypothetical protein
VNNEGTESEHKYKIVGPINKQKINIEKADKESVFIRFIKPHQVIINIISLILASVNFFLAIYLNWFQKQNEFVMMGYFMTLFSLVTCQWQEYKFILPNFIILLLLTIFDLEEVYRKHKNKNKKVEAKK